VDLSLWNPDLRNKLMAERGSVQNIKEVPVEIKNLYKTVWEVKQRVIIDQAAARGPFICQSQSMNIHMPEPTTSKLTSMHFYAWKQGLKTGMYYLRTRPTADAIQFTVDHSALKNNVSAAAEDDDECVMCSA
jgi:ribonucleoside-diphosphate reductase alpha chain